MGLTKQLAKSFGRMARMSVEARMGRYRQWPDEAVLIDEPLALAETKTNRLRRIYANATRDVWDGPAVFREAMAKHGGIQLSHAERVAMSHPISMLMWGELGAWIVSAELAERLDDPDARLAASSQVFDEARHFYMLRDYLAALHVPVPKLDPYFTIAVRSLLTDRDLTLKLLAMQILAEGTAQAIFQFMAESQVEPVLAEFLPLMEKDEARHVGLGIMQLPERLSKLSPKQCQRMAARVASIGDMFAATQLRYLEHYETLGLDARELFRRADRILHGLSKKLGNVPGTSEPYFRTNDPTAPNYEKLLAIVVPRSSEATHPTTKLIFQVVDFGARALPH